VKIFVYGTLKRGQPLHYALQAQTFVGEARTLQHFRLFSLGDYPGLVRAESLENGVSIEGEIWEIDAACLAELDEIEAVEEGEYARISMPLHEPFQDADVEGYVYLGSVEGLEEVGTRW
jgi:gamma-glutamylaminecyclotransferase